MATEDDIKKLLKSWSEDKEELARIEARIEKYKKLANKIMDNNEEDIISTSRYTLKRRIQNRTTISKFDVPSDIWKTYARKVSYQAFYLKENEDNKVL